MRKIAMLKTNLETAMMYRLAGVCPEKEAKKERGDQLMEILGVIIIAIVVLAFFKEQITSIFSTAISSVSEKITALFNPAA